MKRQDLNKYHHQDIPTLKQAIRSLEQTLVETRLKLRLNQEKNLHRVKNLRQDIARLRTIIRHQVLTGQAAISQVTLPVPKPTTTPPQPKPVAKAKPKKATEAKANTKPRTKTSTTHKE